MECQPPPPVPAGLRVLIVEDEAVIAAYVEEILRELHCVVVGVAATLADALKLAGEADINAAILDVKLGQDFAHPVADTLAARRMPFVVSTGYPEPPQGFPSAPLINKPFSTRDLEQALATCFSQPGAAKGPGVAA